MKSASVRIIRAMLGYILYAVGIVCTLNAQLGLAPWGVFHTGFVNQFAMTLGMAVKIVGAAILVLDFILGERIGWGTIGNVYFIGTFIDVVNNFGFIPTFDNIYLRFLQMIVGMIIISLATFLYLGAQLGAGPRDGLMVALTKRTNKPVGIIRSAIEITALTIGYLMGGMVGWGTVIMSLGMGYFIQTVFKIFNFDVRKVVHRYLDQDIAYLKAKFGKT